MKNINLKNVVAIIMTLLMVVTIYSPYTYGNQTVKSSDRINGLKPVSKKILKVDNSNESKKKLKRAQELLPDKYRSDEQVWAEGIKVKDQSKTGLCWAFANTTAAEYSWAKESYEKTGKVAEMSPTHLGYFFYNRVNDPLGNTAGDKNVCTSEDGWPLQGGDTIYAMQHLATYSGVGLEENTPFDVVNSRIVDYMWDDSFKPYDNKWAYNNYVTLENTKLYIDSIDTDELKKLVYNYGAASIAVTFDWRKYMNLEEIDGEGNKYTSGRSFYNYEKSIANHGVTVVGWDDDYPATNFAHKIKNMDDDKALALTTPSRDGAWIVQNSWGTSEHENGFYYMSYESSDMENGIEACVLDMQQADEYQYNFQYDGSADCGDSSDPGNERFYTTKNASAANVYTNTTDTPIQIEAVGFTTFNEGESEYKISVYKNLKKADDPTSGLLAGTTTASVSDAGVKTAVLDKAIPIDTGETYSIVFTFPSANHFGVEKQRDDFVVKVNDGQSFFKGRFALKWKDMADYNACFRIKALANAIDEYPEDEYPTEETTEETTQETTTQSSSEEVTTIPSTVTTSVQKEEITTKANDISAKKVKITSLKAKKSCKAIIKWRKIGGVSGYQIRYSTSKSFKKRVKKIKVKGPKKCKRVIGKLKAKKKYYFQVRLYINYVSDNTTKTVYGKWSKKKSIKVKK